MADSRRFIKSRPVTKDDDGHRLCVWCSKPVPPHRLKYCSDACLHEIRLRRDGPYLRAQVFKRDKGICALCGCDTEKLKRVIRHMPRMFWYEEKAFLKPLGFNYGSSFWHADHINPVVKGGGQCGLENIRTLCVPCHKEETRKLRQELRSQKRGGGWRSSSRRKAARR